MTESGLDRVYAYGVGEGTETSALEECMDAVAHA